MPDLYSIGLGGGSIISKRSKVTSVGPQSVGRQLEERALCFGGNVFTATDAAIRGGLCENFGSVASSDLGDLVDRKDAEAAVAMCKRMLETAIDQIKVRSNGQSVNQSISFFIHLINQPNQFIGRSGQCLAVGHTTTDEL